MMRYTTQVVRERCLTMNNIKTDLIVFHEVYQDKAGVLADMSEDIFTLKSAENRLHWLIPPESREKGKFIVTVRYVDEE